MQKVRGRLVLLMLLCSPLLLAAVLLPSTGGAASPPGGTVSVGHPLSWTFAPVGGPNGTTAAYNLTVQLPEEAKKLYALNAATGTNQAVVLTVHLKWAGNSPDQTLGLTATDANGNSVGSDTLAATNAGGDVNTFMLQNPEAKTYTLTAANQLTYSSQDTPSQATATLSVVNLAAEKAPAPDKAAPGFSDYRIPLSLMPPTTEEQNVTHGRAFGEPSIAVNPKTNAVMYQAGLYTMRGTFDDSTTPAAATWTNTSSPLTNTFSEDAILAMDPRTGRTVVSQLVLACSLSTISDNDGASWTPAAKACQTPAAIDHQTIAFGPFAPPLTATPAYPDAAYYCSQNIAYASCALSTDGGITYGHGLSPMYTSAQCFGLHGHVVVAPDGAVIVPNKACGSAECGIVSTEAGPNCHPGFAISLNDGQTWQVREIIDGHSRLFNTGDPAVAVGPKGTMYFGYGDRSGQPRVAVCSHDGSICSRSVNVGAAFHIANTEMASVVVGDDDRAAFAFLGSQTPGNDQASNVTVKDASGKTVNQVSPTNGFLGAWHLYIATTYDGGTTWHTVDATPGAPIERGCIEFNATCPSSRGADDQRNLLDFNEVSVDAQGRILAAYTDGCQSDATTTAINHGTCAQDASRLSGLAPEIEAPAVARQSCGEGLYAKFDAMMKPCSSEQETTAAR